MNIIFKMTERMLYSGQSIKFPKATIWKSAGYTSYRMTNIFCYKNPDSYRWNPPNHMSKRYTK